MSKILHIFLIFFMLAGKTTASSYCYSTTLYATTSKSTKSLSYYTNYDDCTITIRPSSYYSGGSYYLEIKWLSFDVKGNMPNCYNDYVEVFLTSSYRSIGKYCSSNLQSSSLFNMYSYDGYAKIKFHSDSSVTGRGFSFSYELKSKSSEYLGSSSQTYCSSSTSYSSSDYKYSQGWPKRYAQSYSACTQKVYVGSSYQARVAFMDIDTNNYLYCGYSSSDYVQLQGSDSSYSSYPSSISSKLCSVSSIKAYTVKYYNYFYIKFNRQRGGSSNRGFVSGYITYNPKKVTVGSNTTAIVAGSIVGAVIFLIVLVLVIVYMCKRNRTHGAIVRQNPANTAILATTNTASSGTTVMSQTVNAYPGTGAQMQYTSAYPTSYQKPAGYPQDPVYTGNPMTATYPTATTYQTAPGAGQPAFYPPASQGYGQAPMAPPAGIPTEPPPAYVQVNPSAP